MVTLSGITSAKYLYSGSVQRTTKFSVGLFSALLPVIKAEIRLLHQINLATQRLLYLVYMAPDPITISAAAVVANQSQANAYRCVLQVLTQLAIIAGYMPAP